MSEKGTPREADAASGRAADLDPPAPVAGEAQRRAAERFIEEAEGVVCRFRGVLAIVTTTLLAVMKLYQPYAAIEILPAQVLRPVHVGFVLMFAFLPFPIAPRSRNGLMPWDVASAG